MSFVYLASPYSHADPAVRQMRFDAACKKAAEYVAQGLSVFAPIPHSHSIANHMTEQQSLDFDLWMRVDLPLLRMSSELHVLTIEGWEQSRGVTREVLYAKQALIPIKYVRP